MTDEHTYAQKAEDLIRTWEESDKIRQRWHALNWTAATIAEVRNIIGASSDDEVLTFGESLKNPRVIRAALQHWQWMRRNRERIGAINDCLAVLY